MIFPEQLDEEDMDLFTKEAKLSGCNVYAQASKIASEVLYRTFYPSDGGPRLYAKIGQGQWQLTNLGEFREEARKTYERRKNRKDEDSSIPS